MDDSPAFLNVARSALGHRWVGPSAAVERLGLAIAQTAQVPEIVGRLMAARGVAPADARAYLAPTLRELMPDPLTLRDMGVAAGRLAAAVRGGQRVAVFGDYDVDGGAATALLVLWLRHFGLAATAYIPDRIDEGYGPNAPAMAALGVAHDLVICVDCGTLSHAAIAACTAPVLVIDHHLGGETLPPALAVVNPNRPDDDSGLGHLCAAGVVFLTLVATNRLLRGDRAVPDLMGLLDLVALATVADVAPLVGLNRAFVRQGLRVLAARGRPGLAALADVAGLRAPPTSRDLGFALGPRLNAGGRVGRADLGVRLLTTDDPHEAAALAQALDQLNRDRQGIEAAVLDLALAQAEVLDAGAPLVWAAGAGWHPGVLGIVAARLRERFNRPAMVIGIDGGVAKGSGRSVPGVDLGSAVAWLVARGLALQGGGHRMAAGLTLAPDGVPAAMAALGARLTGGPLPGAHDLPIDGALALGGATADLVEMLEAAGPFGQANPPPRLAFCAVRVAGLRAVGQGHAQVRLTELGGARLDAIAFRVADTPLAATLASGVALHLVGRLELDDWGGRRRAKLRIEDAAPALGA